MEKYVVNNGIIMNAHCIEIKVCCASCAHRLVSLLGERVCGQLRQHVASNEYCMRYELSEGMARAGCSGGQVKRKEYLDFCRKKWLDGLTMNRLTRHPVASRTSLADIRAEWEREHGSIYLF